MTLQSSQPSLGFHLEVMDCRSECVRSCTRVYTVLNSLVQVCTIVYGVVQVCTIMYSLVKVCISMYSIVEVCTSIKVLYNGVDL